MKFSIFFFLAFNASALSAQDYVNLVTEKYPPFQIIGERNEVFGFSTDVVKETFKRAGIKHKIYVNPWSISYNQALREKNTCIYSIAYSQQRKNLFNWIGKIHDSRLALYSLKDKRLKVSSLEQVKSFSVAVVRDYLSHQYLVSKGFKENLNLYVSDNYDSHIQLIEKRKTFIDFLLLNDSLLGSDVNASVLKKKLDRHDVLPELNHSLYLACNKNTEKSITRALTNTMSQLQKDGTMRQIELDWRQEMTN